MREDERPTLDAGQYAQPTAPSGGATPAAPKAVGRYQLLELIGQGGMGSVYVAVDPALGRKVAVKLLPATAQRLTEARALARIAHPNVVAIYDVGEHLGPSGERLAWLAMELLQGEPADLWARGRRSWREVLTVFARAGAGLRAVHREGLVHGDFKASNVMVRTDGRVQLIDFGIARKAAATDGPRSDSISGTPGYMSPEQLEGRPLSAASDQFSFCVCLWEALVGELPFGQSADVAQLDRITAGPPPLPPALKLPRRLGAALRKGLAADPAQRFGSMRQLLTALGRAIPPSRSGWALVALAAAAAGVLVAAAWLASSPNCAPARAQPLATWTDTFAARVAQHHGPAVLARLEGYARGLSVLSERVCLDFARGKMAPAELVEERSCLKHRTSEWLSLCEALAAGGDARAADALVELDTCGGPGPRQKVADFERLLGCRAQLAAVANLMADGRWGPSLEAVPAAQQCAYAQQDAALLSTSLRYEGLLRDRLGDLLGAEARLHDAAEQALRGGEEAVGPAWVALARVVGLRQRGRAREAERWLTYATAAAQARPVSRELAEATALLELQLAMIDGREPAGEVRSLGARAWRGARSHDEAAARAALAGARTVDELMDLGEALRLHPASPARAQLVAELLRTALELLEPRGPDASVARLWFVRLARELGAATQAAAALEPLAAVPGWPGALARFELAVQASARGDRARAAAQFEALAPATRAEPLLWLEPARAAALAAP